MLKRNETSCVNTTRTAPTEKLIHTQFDPLCFGIYKFYRRTIDLLCVTHRHKTKHENGLLQLVQPNPLPFTGQLSKFLLQPLLSAFYNALDLKSEFWRFRFSVTYHFVLSIDN